MFLEVKNISKSYNSNSILEGITFSQEKGEIISIIGSSGEGKTTLLNCLSGLIDINSGSIKLNSQQIEHVNASKRNISYVFQESPLFPHLNVLENILFNLNHPDDKELEDLISKTSINALLKKYPYELSGGENQRVAVVRSLIRKPDLLLMDEPFSNLDSFNKKKLKEILFKLIKSNNITTIIVNHDVEKSIEISDRIMIIDAGKISTLEKPEVIYKYPKSLKIANLFGEVTFFKLDDKIIYIRPENLKIVSQSKNKFSVISSRYIGGRYRIEAIFLDHIIVLYHNFHLKKGLTLFFDFNKEDILKI